ncbi:MAG: phospholipid carrier-dependent glycosyltransferase [Actinobacteria bacterium]|nr:phospholipid carrier-dependent glycosyltransferase [Actinomycetota bacterium]
MVAAIAPLLIAALSLILRLFDIASIKTLIFDEVYYVDGARDLLAYGVEVDQANPEFIVHPPIGKWMIASGIKVFGDNPFGWRVATAVVGALMILLIALIAHKLFYSPLLTALASALMALDGMTLVHSRTAMLDNFLAFFILIATYFFISRLYMWSGLFLGLALATKWSASYFIALFGVIALYRVFSHYTGRDLIIPTLRRAIAFAVIPLSTYLISWWGWFASDRGWGRDHSKNPITSFVYYHNQILNFHTNLTDKHDYQANPWSWLILGRPTSFFYESPKNCGADSCSQEVLALGTPLLWWLATIALAIVIGFWIRSLVLRQRDPAASIIVVGMAAGYLPWFFMQHRTVFSFYSIVFEPFLILALVYCAKLFLQTQGKKGGRAYLYAQMTLGTVVILIAMNFIYFLPLYLGLSIPYSDWVAHMWFKSWI